MRDPLGREITYLRVSVTELCNLRCRYCMPASGVCKRRHDEMLREEELLLAVRAAAQLGIRKVRITGGEPLVKKNILSICRGIARTPGIEEVCLTTNGTLLPPLAAALREAGVDRVNLSLDTLDPEKYAHITRCGSLDAALRGLEAALAAGFSQVKVNAVLLRGINDGEIPALADLTRRYPVDVRFIELMPMDAGPEWDGGAYLPCEAVLARLPDLVPAPEDGGVARLYRLPGAMGRVGLIAPVSGCFCAQCDRLRLTADGQVRPCLHSPLAFPLKGLDQAGMAAQLRAAVAAKPARHGDLTPACPSGAGRAMHRIGG